jgi:hypothetical protein
VDPALPERLKELKQLVGDTKMTQDFQAIGLMQSLTKDVAALHPKDKERLGKGLGEVFRTGKVRPPEKDILYREAADALAKLGSEGGKELAKAYGDTRFKDAVPLLGHLLLAIGRSEDEKQVDLLVEVTTRSHHDELRGASGEALGNFVHLEVKQRREVVKAIIREWGAQHARATQAESTDPSAPINVDRQNAVRTLRAAEGKWAATLGKLTGQSVSGFADWQRWLNKNPNWVPPATKKP